MARQPRKQTAVLIPVFRDDRGNLRLVLVLRGVKGMHGGQLGLPGGAAEAADSSPLETALREAEEEIGLRREEVEILADLDPIDTRTTGLRVHPYLAHVPSRSSWHVASDEIQGVVTPLVGALTERSRRHKKLISFPTWPEPRLTEYVEIDGDQLLWGLTLRLLDAVLPRLQAGEWKV